LEALKELENILNSAKAEIASCADEAGIENARIKYLGKKGMLTQIMKTMSEIPAEQRPAFGVAVNSAKEEFGLLYEKKSKELSGQQAGKFSGQDITLPGRKIGSGRVHPLTLVLDEVTGIFKKLGFMVVDGNEVETDYYNFDALNHPKDHPARNVQDTFYLGNEVLLRTHTSPIQIRVMEKIKPPVKIVAIGKCYRRDAVDASHSPVFHQMEGLIVDNDINFGHLKGTLSHFLTKFFGKERKIRFTPSFFPFTEPSAEVSISCSACNGKGCRICGNGYLEILGCGMVDPNVFKYVNYDPEQYSGFAFGVGIERLAILKYGIEDIRHFYENDLRFLRQF